MSRLGKKVVLYLVERQKYGLDDSSRRLLDLMLQGYGSDEIAQLEGICACGATAAGTAVKKLVVAE